MNYCKYVQYMFEYKANTAISLDKCFKAILLDKCFKAILLDKCFKAISLDKCFKAIPISLNHNEHNCIWRSKRYHYY